MALLDGLLEAESEEAKAFWQWVGLLFVAQAVEDCLLDSQPDLVAENSGYLRSLYSVVKGRDDNLSLSFLTDVSKFSKVSL